MEPPKNVKVFENTSSTYWLDDDGIICSISKKVPPPSIEVSKREIEELRKQFGNKKYCYLLDITNASPTPKEAREFAAEELPKLIRALAMISKSALGRMVAWPAPPLLILLKCSRTSRTQGTG